MTELKLIIFLMIEMFFNIHSFNSDIWHVDTFIQMYCVRAIYEDKESYNRDCGKHTLEIINQHKMLINSNILILNYVMSLLLVSVMVLYAKDSATQA
ncbi:hypothetical protein PPL_09961 [Heterostelium album PN500]|uniref:Uncharacterized protein n=1 Tax=Heterostelium pallidum (strain ATCC 26659 / Pp 5 / PN500) TaxID=670386 RepID=D3BPN6_HETP5|nr:hypothetical protein PPL_09961 [Heterostelium album PN500]EFA76656.1 hypothetical protein PPL_09961 [Heterostelium album PN500]|eukprot:XP_020428788.1 hypothetical protein PPL_09961 [Heterostelium album PN500]